MRRALLGNRVCASRPACPSPTRRRTRSAGSRHGRAEVSGRSSQIASIGFLSRATSSAPTFAAASRSALASPIVCSQGSNPMRAPLVEVFANPGRRRIVDQALRREQGHVRLAAHLQRIAAVDEDDRLVLEDERHARRPGKAGQPAQAFRPRRDIFALMLVGTRHQKAVKLLARSARPAAWRRAERRPKDRLAMRSSENAAASVHGYPPVCAADPNAASRPGNRQDTAQPSGPGDWKSAGMRSARGVQCTGVRSPAPADGLHYPCGGNDLIPLKEHGHDHDQIFPRILPQIARRLHRSA